jgi:hypothetical protein
VRCCWPKRRWRDQALAAGGADHTPRGAPGPFDSMHPVEQDASNDGMHLRTALSRGVRRSLAVRLWGPRQAASAPWQLAPPAPRLAGRRTRRTAGAGGAALPARGAAVASSGARQAAAARRRQAPAGSAPARGAALGRSAAQSNRHCCSSAERRAGPAIAVAAGWVGRPAALPPAPALPTSPHSWTPLHPAAPLQWRRWIVAAAGGPEPGTGGGRRGPRRSAACGCARSSPKRSAAPIGQAAAARHGAAVRSARGSPGPWLPCPASARTGDAGPGGGAPRRLLPQLGGERWQRARAGGPARERRRGSTPSAPAVQICIRNSAADAAWSAAHSCCCRASAAKLLAARAGSQALGPQLSCTPASSRRVPHRPTARPAAPAASPATGPRPARAGAVLRGSPQCCAGPALEVALGPSSTEGTASSQYTRRICRLLSVACAPSWLAIKLERRLLACFPHAPLNCRLWPMR